MLLIKSTRGSNMLEALLCPFLTSTTLPLITPLPVTKSIHAHTHLSVKFLQMPSLSSLPPHPLISSSSAKPLLLFTPKKSNPTLFCSLSQSPNTEFKDFPIHNLFGGVVLALKNPTSKWLLLGPQWSFKLLLL